MMRLCKCFSHASKMPTITYNQANNVIIKTATILNIIHNIFLRDTSIICIILVLVLLEKVDDFNHRDLVSHYGISVSQMSHSVCRNHNLILSSFMDCHRICNKSNTCHMWSKNCLPSRSNKVHPRFLVGFVLLSLWVSV